MLSSDPQIFMTNQTTTYRERVSFIWENDSYKVHGQYFEFSCSDAKGKIYTWVFHKCVTSEIVVLRYSW